MRIVDRGKRLVKSYKDLEVFNNSFELAMEIFEKSKAFPNEERYSLTDQIRRSSRSVCANIAEAWRKRRYKAAFISKLNDAETEACETQVWVHFAYRCGYWDATITEKVNDDYDHVIGQLMSMIIKADRWIYSEDTP